MFGPPAHGASREPPAPKNNPDADMFDLPLFFDIEKAIVDAVQQIAEARGVPMAQIALDWGAEEASRHRPHCG
jgi:aryl-alcohol dehydrogenase-like predicted oxidoreductase